MSPTVKQVAKRSRALHTTVKLAKVMADAPTVLPRDPRRAADIVRVLPNTMLSLPALANVYECARTVERDGIEGDVAECGVWAGGAIGLMAQVNRRYGHQPRTFHLFDSFEGLPQPSELDTDVVDSFKDEHPDLTTDDGESAELVAIGACASSAYTGSTLDDVHDLFDNVLKIDPSRYVVHQGWFQTTVPAAIPTIGPLAILRLDGDWYESTKTCLEGLFDQIAPGGFLILDDYGFFSGCTRAVDEFLLSRGLSPADLTVEPWGSYLRRPA